MAKKKGKKKAKPSDPNAWMITFSDLMTLLLTFFVLLLTMKSMDTKALQRMFGIFTGAVGMFGFGEKTIMTPSVVLTQRIRVDMEILRKLLDTTSLESKPPSEALELKGGGGEEAKGRTGGFGGGKGLGAGEMGGELKTITSKLEGEKYSSLEEDFSDIIDFALGKKSEGEGGESELSDMKDISMMRTTRGIVAQFPDKILFASGSAKLHPRSLPLLEKIGNFIIEKKYRVEIEGHTDNTPIHTEEFPSNWELSTTRAVNVLRFFTARFDIPPDRISALGFGDKAPLVPNVSEKKRKKNRRVVIVFHK